MDWRDDIPGWPSVAGDLVVLERLWRAATGQGGPMPAVHGLAIVPAAWPDLAEPSARTLHGVVGRWFTAQNEAQPDAVPAGVQALLLSCDAGAPVDRAAVADLIWTLQLRRLQYLRERPDALAAAELTPLDLSDLDELVETEFHYTRARIEQGRLDGSGIALLVAATTVAR